LIDAAQESGVVTQLGNQGHSSGSIRTFCEWIWDGAIGQVQEVHACCDAFKDVYSQIRNLPRRAERTRCPPIWTGTCGWVRRPSGRITRCTCRGTGAAGRRSARAASAIGSAMWSTPVFWALDLGAPVSVQAEVDGYDPVEHAEVYPPGTAITFEFAAKGDRGPVKLVWYDGNRRPPRPKDLEEGRNPPGTGAVVIGDQGTITYGSHGAGGVRIVPEAKMQEYKTPEPTLPRVPGHHADWTNAIREGRPAGSALQLRRPADRVGPAGHDRRPAGRHETRVGRPEHAFHQQRRSEPLGQSAGPSRLGHRIAPIGRRFR
jgi:hypothetical protein